MKCFLHLCNAEAFDEITAGIKSTTPNPRKLQIVIVWTPSLNPRTQKLNDLSNKKSCIVAADKLLEILDLLKKCN